MVENDSPSQVFQVRFQVKWNHKSRLDLAKPWLDGLESFLDLTFTWSGGGGGDWVELKLVIHSHHHHCGNSLCMTCMPRIRLYHPCCIALFDKNITERNYGRQSLWPNNAIFLPLPSADSVIHSKMYILFIPFDIMFFFSYRLATVSRSCPLNMVGETICSNLQKLAIY